MTISELIAMCERRIVNLTGLRTTHVALGDMEAVARVDDEVAQTETTLAQLRTLVE